ncbi:hypothetical protein [Aneurinibacillus migulanus]|uniref:Uncharacterized protein n=1 Tax=Aneurinibacillus migulanus TaxID=47500 RepID=A0A0D1WGM0_ANEMI|nr:hypothetical protein [Aneurinibacillus migulanus]KIV57680.1 hypothetical protein TS65_09145 [Aneurinibacillus migulanus]KON95860.1 hypothetical protein AF333_10555 [Aneurinibacillus migulanus]MED0891947.1 hypothetical protein [Aneurinibacillus migulanus]MED1617313.1 hypothetical protein [Aneurinibacillus migulanus]SDK26283.1 hypothetical protein SAMN04487909_14617 [Aneurinibacillus migulanus]
MKELFYVVVLDHEDNVIDRVKTVGFPKEEEIDAALDRNISMGYNPEDITAKVDKRYGKE